MCLAVPAKIVSRSGTTALADLHGNRVQISTLLLPQAIPGDWVLVHAGFAIQRLDEQQVRQTWQILDDLERLTGHSPAGHRPAGPDAKGARP